MQYVLLVFDLYTVRFLLQLALFVQHYTCEPYHVALGQLFSKLLIWYSFYDYAIKFPLS